MKRLLIVVVAALATVAGAVHAQGLANNRVCLLGDSRLAYDFINSSTAPGGAIVHNAKGIGYWWEALSGGRVRVLFADGLAGPGYSSGDIISKGALDKAVVAPCATVLLLASTNDTHALGKSASSSILNLQTIIDRLVQAKKRVVAITELPRGNAASPDQRFTPGERAQHMKVRAWLAATAPTTFGPLYVPVDAYADWLDPDSVTGDVLATPGLTEADGLHPGTTGAFRIGMRLANDPAVMAPYPAIDATASRPQGQDLLPDAGMADPPIPAPSGQVAAGWAFSVNGGEGLKVVTALAADPPGTRRQTITVRGNAGTGAPMVFFSQNLDYDMLKPGDRLDAGGRFEIAPNCRGMQDFGMILFRLTDTGKGVFEVQTGTGGQGPLPTQSAPISGVWRLAAGDRYTTVSGAEKIVQVAVVAHAVPGWRGVSCTLTFTDMWARKLP